MNTLFKDLNVKFGCVTAVIALGVMLVSQSLLMKQARVGMESRLAEKASFVNTYYAFLVADALQRKDDVTLLQVVNRLEEDPEITAVVVVDDKGEVRYHADPEKLGTVWNDPTLTKALDTGDGIMTPFNNSGGRALALVSPLKVQGKTRPLGAVRVEMTYRHVQDQLSKFDSSFHLAILGFISTAVGFMMVFVRRWVTLPLEEIEKAVSGMHLSTAEPTLPEGPDEYGRLNKAVNAMVLRFRAELQDLLGTGQSEAGPTDREFIERLLQSFIPGANLIIADKDNAILSYRSVDLPITQDPAHLLDLITDVNFANLVGAAFQKEGEPTRGSILYHDKPYLAIVLCIPSSQSKTVKTVIALIAQSEKGESSS